MSRTTLVVLVAVLLLGAAVAYVSLDGEFAVGEATDEEDRTSVDADGPSSAADDERRVVTPEGYDPEQYPTSQRYAAQVNPGSQDTWVPEERVPLDDPDELTSEVVEVDRYLGADLEDRHVEAAWRLYRDSFEAAEEAGYFDLTTARSDGFKKWNSIHYINTEYYLDNETLDPRKPESLVYFSSDRDDDSRDPEQMTLVGVMYLAPSLEAEGEQIGGPSTVWHYHPRHPKQCFHEALDEGVHIDAPPCPDGAARKFRTPEMIHVWFIEHPDGPFATDPRVVEGEVPEPSMMDREEFETHLDETTDLAPQSGG